MKTVQPTKEELNACARVAKIPLERRVILSMSEALELERRRAASVH